MKKLLAPLGWLLLLLPFISVAGTKTLLTTIESSSESETRNVSNFRGVSSGGSFDVYIKMGSTESLRLEGDADILEEIETKVENGILKIGMKRNTGIRWNWGNNKVKVYITAKQLNSLNLSGSGKMEVSGTVNVDKVDTKISGSGDMSLSVSASQFNSAISGSGNVRVSGNAKSSNIAISGSGEFDGKDLKTSDTHIKVSGSGEAYLHVDRTLNASVSGSGDVVYTGNPQVNQSKSGSGSIRKR